MCSFFKLVILVKARPDGLAVSRQLPRPAVSMYDAQVTLWQQKRLDPLQLAMPRDHSTYLDVHRCKRHSPVFFRQQGRPITYRDNLICCPAMREHDRCTAYLHSLAIAKSDAWIARWCPIDDEVVGYDGTVSKTDQQLEVSSRRAHTSRAGKRWQD